MTAGGSLLAIACVAVLVSGCGSGSTSGSAGTGAATTTTQPAHTGASTTPSSTRPPDTSPTSVHPTTTAPSSSAPATEFSPPGDIPDNQVFVPYLLPGTRLAVSVPEGWARSSQQGVVTFTDKLNSIAIQVVPQRRAPTVATARRTELPALASSVSQYAAGDVTSVNRKSGHAVLITYQQDSAQDPVTGKVVRDAVERYEFWHSGQEAILTLSGPTGADNVDPWRIVTDSVTWK
jgi:hypothetical protein